MIADGSLIPDYWVDRLDPPPRSDRELLARWLQVAPERIIAYAVHIEPTWRGLRITHLRVRLS